MSFSLRNLGKFMARRSFSSTRDEFYEDMALSIKAGSSLNEILRSSAERAMNAGQSGLGALYGDWAENLGDISIAGSFAEAIAEDVPTTDVMVLRGFEASGKLPDGLMELSKLVKNGRKMRSAIMGAVAMPAFSFLVILGVGGFFGAKILPTLASVVPVEKWPGLGAVVYYFTTTIANYSFLIVLALLAFAKLFAWSLNNWTGRIRRKFDQVSISPYNLYKNYQSGTVLIVLSALLKSGSSMDSGLRLLAGSGGRWMSMYLSESIDALGDQSTTDPAAAFDTGFLQQRIFWRLQDAAKRASFPDAVKSIAETAFEKLSNGIIVQAKVINQASMLVAGLTLLAMVAGVLQVGMSMKELMAQ